MVRRRETIVFRPDQVRHAKPRLRIPANGHDVASLGHNSQQVEQWGWLPIAVAVVSSAALAFGLLAFMVALVCGMR